MCHYTNLQWVVGNGTYVRSILYSLTVNTERLLKIGFLVLTLLGVLIPLLMVNPRNMIRTDGTKVTTLRHPSWKVELYGLWLTLRTDPMIILLFPMFLASNWFYTWRTSGFTFEYMGTY